MKIFLNISKKVNLLKFHKNLNFNYMIWDQKVCEISSCLLVSTLLLVSVIGYALDIFYTDLL